LFFAESKIALFGKVQGADPEAAAQAAASEEESVLSSFCF
jgi:hypothetical protein